MKFITVKFSTALFSLSAFLALMAVSGIVLQHCTVGLQSDSAHLPIRRVERNDKKIAVTFNADTDAKNIDATLSALGNTKATFFLSGSFVRNHPDEVLSLHKAGHQIANYSDTLPDYTRLSPDGIQKELQNCSDSIFSLTGARPVYCRIPYNAYTPEVLSVIRENGYSCVQWALDSHDWRNPSPHVLTDYVTKQATPGAILLFHLGNPATQKALPEILYRLQKDGLEAVTLSELLYPDSYTVTGDGTQILIPAPNGETVS